MDLNRLVSRIVRGIWYLPKTLYVNLCILPFSQGKKFPVIMMGDTCLKGLNRGNMVIEGPIKRGMIRIGAQKTGKRGLLVNKRTSVIVLDGGKITFKGEASIGQGSSICAKGGDITFGNLFSCNVNCFIYSQKKVCIGEDVLLGWNVNIRDNDGHPMYDINHERVNPDREISIGNHVWVASFVDIIKGSELADGTIVGTRSLVAGVVKEKNSIITGVPARIIKRNINWEH